MRKKASKHVSSSKPARENQVLDWNRRAENDRPENGVSRRLSTKNFVHLIFADPFAENSRRRVEEITQINPQIEFKTVEINEKDIVAQISDELQKNSPASVDSLWIVSGCEISSEDRPSTHGFCSQLSWQKSDRRIGGWKKYLTTNAKAFILGSGSQGFAEQIEQNAGIEVHCDFQSLPSAKFDEVIFIDGGVTNFEPVVRNILLDRDADIVLLDSQQDGLKQMADALKNRKGIKSIHLICHGAPGVLVIGDSAVNSQSIQGHARSLSTIGNALAKDGDIQIYGGSFNQGPCGMQTARMLSGLTGAFIIVSNSDVDLGTTPTVESLAATDRSDACSMSQLDVLLPPMVFPKKSAGIAATGNSPLGFMADEASMDDEAAQRIKISYEFDARQALGWLCIGTVAGFGVAMTLLKMGAF